MENLVSTHVVAGVVLSQEGKYLFVQEKQPECYGKWNLPAGRVEVGDSIEETAIKEAKEETGFDVKLGRKLGIWQDGASRPPKHLYNATIIAGKLKFPEDEILDARWFTLTELRGMKDQLRDPSLLEAILESEGDKHARLKAGVDYTGVTIYFCCHDGEGNFLLHKRSTNCRDEQGAWDCGGGKLEFGEDFEDGIRREVKEEYGCDCEVGERIDTYSRNRINREGKPTHWVAVGNFVKVRRNEAVLNEPHSMDEIGWFTFDKIPQPLHSSWKMIMEQMPERFLKYINK
jgi:8-oxo-dGTP diphosphatase